MAGVRVTEYYQPSLAKSRKFFSLLR
jgi:hypothetical protein